MLTVEFVEELLLGEEGLACEAEISITTPLGKRDTRVPNE
jgi:hypothetical protein